MEHKTIVIRLDWRPRSSSSTDGYALFYGDVELTRDYNVQLESLKFRLFDEEMTKYLNDGWKPYGNPIITDHNHKIIQFLTRELNPAPGLRQRNEMINIY